MSNQPTQNVRREALAKINIALRVRGRREDGYHILDMLNCTVSLADEVRLRISPGTGHITLRTEIEPDMANDAAFANPEQNIAVRAARRFFDTFRPDWDLEIDLRKRIPLGAGLGGGSSNAATVLRVLAERLGPVCTDDTLRALALELGADVPFLLQGGLASVEGIGEIVRPLRAEELAPLPAVLVCPRVHCATKEVFQRFSATGEIRERRQPLVEEYTELALKKGAVKALLQIAENDLEPIVRAQYYRVDQILSRLEALPGVVARLTGSGSTVFVLPAQPPAEPGREADRMEREVRACLADLPEAGSDRIVPVRLVVRPR